MKRAMTLVTLMVLAASVPSLAASSLDSIDPLIESHLGVLGGGASLAIVQNGKVILRRHYGTFADETVVPIASASKWISAAVIMSMVDEGKLSLDDRVIKYIPSFSGDKSSITIRQLLSHTSGLPAETGLSSSGCLSDRFTTLAACAGEIAAGPLIAAPGTEFNYGGLSMQVAGRVAEIVEGKAWEEIFQKRMAQPLALTTMTYGSSANPLIAGGVRSSLDDYVHFLQMILNRGVLNGRMILSAASVDEMQKDQTRGAAIGFTPYEKYGYLDPALPSTRYGLGEWLERVDATGRTVEVSCQGAFGFSPWIDKERMLVGVLMVSSSLVQVMPVYLDLKQIVRTAIAPVPKSRRRAVVPH
jgi:CubicO group peptidase (beta-lactamase class C family)